MTTPPGTLLDFLLAKRGTTVEDLPKNAKVSREARKYGVRASTEFRRIDALPRRTWVDDPELPELIELLTARYKTPRGTQTLWASQAIVIKEAFELRGAIGGLRVSGGKTLPSMLIPTVLEAKRPVLFVPAKLRAKTENAYRVLAEHWQVHPGLCLRNYEELSSPHHFDWLLKYQPDCVLGDEAHKLRNDGAACRSRLDDFRELSDRERPGFVTYVFLSGTFYRKKPTDVGGLAEIALRGGSPVPRTWKEADDWDSALDPKARNPISPGALIQWAEPGVELTPAVVREGFGRRMTETPGVIMSSGAGVDCALIVTADIKREHPEAEQHFETLRTKAEAPDGWELVDAPAVWALAQQLELGFYYVWDPRPPLEWREARKEWVQYARKRIRYRDRSDPKEPDTEGRVAVECAARAAGGRPVPEYERWKVMEPTFKKNVKAVWFSDRRVQEAAAWLRAGGKKGAPGLVWSMHRAFGRRLSEVAQVPFYSNNAEDADGNSIVYAKAGPAVVSCFAINEGQDLQDRWARALYPCPMSPGEQWEQTVARIHRFGQSADEVTVDVWLGCTENYNALLGARAEEFANAEATLDRARKLVVADWTFPAEPSELLVFRMEGEWVVRKGASWRWVDKFVEFDASLAL